MVPNPTRYSKKENQQIFVIPKGKSGYIFGPESSNLKQIIANSGTDIKIIGKKHQECRAIITGTIEEREKAVKLLQESLGRSNSFSPIMGFTLLDDSNNDDDSSFLLHFKQISDDDDDHKNRHRNNDFRHFPTPFDKCILEIMPLLPYSPNNYNDYYKGYNAYNSYNKYNYNKYYNNNLSFNNLSGKIYSFNTISQLSSCLDKIVDQISSNFKVNDNLLLNFNNINTDNNNHYYNYFYNNELYLSNEFCLKINFGRGLFTKLSKNVLSLSEWNQLKRGHEGITTAFRHDITIKFLDQEIKKFFGFKEIHNNKKNNHDDNDDDDVGECYITVLYMEDDKKNEFKLRWNSDEECWKIIKLTKDVRRQAIIDIISGKIESPDLRFLLKSQNRPSPINEKYHKAINDLQYSKTFLRRLNCIKNNNNINGGDKLCDKLYFRQSDFNENFSVKNFKCTSVRQSIIKKKLVNDKYMMNFISTLQDEDGRVTLEDTVNLINLSWTSSPPPTRESITTMNPQNPKFNESIVETINFAKEITKKIGESNYLMRSINKKK